MDSVKHNSEIQNKTKKLLTTKGYQLINSKYQAFPIIYKYIHGIKIDKVSEVDIKKDFNFVYQLFFGFQKSTKSHQEKIQDLQSYSKEEYDKIAHDKFILFLGDRDIDVEDYFKIKDLISQIASVKSRFNAIINFSSIQQEAHKIYVENNGNLDKKAINSVKNQVANTLQKQNQQKRHEQKKKQNEMENYKKERKRGTEGRIKEKEKVALLSEHDKLQEKLTDFKNKILVDIPKIGKEFLEQLDILINISTQGGENNDPRFKNFILAKLNKMSAIEYIKLFIHDNKGDLQGEHLRFFSYNKEGQNKTVVSNNDITENVAEYFITKIKIIELQEKNNEN